jgi:hypothetical protein
MYRPKRIFLEISSGVVLDSVVEVLPAIQESFFRPATCGVPSLPPQTEAKAKGNISNFYDK